MKDVAKLVDQQFVEPGLVGWRRALGDDCAGGARFAA